MEEEIERDRTEHGKKPLKKKGSDDDSNPPTPETKTVLQSQVDPESGLFHKAEHKKCFAYVANTACDQHNFVVDFVVGAGNLHDSVLFDDLYKKLLLKVPEVEVIAMDSAYKTPWIMKQIIDSERIPAVPYKRPMTKKGFFKKRDYVYDDYYDCILCPENQLLKYSTTNREGYREYKSNPEVCWSCAKCNECTASQGCQKVVTRHVWEEYIEKAEDYRHTPEYRAIYAQRKETIERVFCRCQRKAWNAIHPVAWTGKS
ncbi:transposase [Desulfitobacterium chlororespirans]|uniref:Transposase DDE domain-containing protein n=1 Tax=Desulfitobacterium chlororespirans DSM 11544 TaxID=1121395 RepID=A0A1M7TP73_9FIRM|nr:transposase [Desulfitobacterium chlororespirans]SHN72476.1 Transposase DDE domain-containing protein [Desulfitobacterium chlororespirans DSM 11544]